MATEAKNVYMLTDEELEEGEEFAVLEEDMIEVIDDAEADAIQSMMLQRLPLTKN